MESEDYPFFQGLVFLLENDVSSLGYELTFSTEVLIFSLCNIHFNNPSFHHLFIYIVYLKCSCRTVNNVSLQI